MQEGALNAVTRNAVVSKYGSSCEMFQTTKDV